MKQGDIILVSSKGGFFTLSGQIRFWTDSNLTHSAQGAGNYIPDPSNPNIIEPMILEASAATKLTRWSYYQNGDSRYWVYSWRKPEHQAISANWARAAQKELDGDYYGVTMLPWFIYRRIIKELHLPKRWAKHDFLHIRGENICSEDVDITLQRTATAILFNDFPQQTLTPIELAALKYTTDYYYDTTAVSPADLKLMITQLVDAGLMYLTERKLS